MVHLAFLEDQGLSILIAIGSFNVSSMVGYGTAQVKNLDQSCTIGIICGMLPFDVVSPDFYLFQFVAHPHCQQLLASIWYSGLPGWRKRNMATKLFIIISLIALMPIMATYYLILPRSRIGQLLRTPFMKFMYHSASFGMFLFLLILVSTKGGSNDDEGHVLRQQQRGPPPTVLEWLIVFYVLGEQFTLGLFSEWQSMQSSLSLFFQP